MKEDNIAIDLIKYEHEFVFIPGKTKPLETINSIKVNGRYNDLKVELTIAIDRELDIWEIKHEIVKAME